VSRLNAKTLNKALFYSKKVYEEALVAKETSLCIEQAVSNFIKELTHNNISESNNNKTKGINRKKDLFWYNVSVM